ncbi:asparagine synthase (glutamine-hydrolyzing) [bacterium]|nr:asparagine synthase (glutamine-hydrolyzing) [bacterium]
MCGIAGLIYSDRARPVEAGAIRAMNAALAHRGPDDEGVWTSGAVGLGHRRLSIIDLSPAGHQPMQNEDGSLRLVFNGEIYNFPELRKQCQERGHALSSHTDSEVILHLYEDFGDAVVERLNGMFAFGLWDARKERLLLAVDRLGKKPIRYSLGPWGLAFGSEIGALLALPEVSREVDHEAIWHYLTLGYIPAPMTGFSDVRKLPAAHRMVYESGRVRLERYWRIDLSHKDAKRPEEWQEEILALLEDAVKIRMESDVPLGAFLSGGVDSSAVVALMARHSSRPVRTFSIGFAEEKYNELPAARDVAGWFSTEHTELVVRPSAMEVFPKLVDAYGEPYADSSALPSYYLAQVTRQYVTVALNGDGGDENRRLRALQSLRGAWTG